MSLWQILEDAHAYLLELHARKFFHGPYGPELPPRDDPRMQDHAPDPGIASMLLGQLSISLRALDMGANATLLPHARLLAAEHGEARLGQGQNIYALVLELLALHECIIEVAAEQNAVITHAEQRVLVRGFQRALAEAVARYTEARDRELQRTHAEHFAFLAHELRSPLSNVRMGIGLIEHGVAVEEVIPRVRRAVDAMRELLDNAISRARLSAGVSLRRETLRLAEVVHAVVLDHEMQARDRDIAIDVEVPDMLLLSADPRLLRSVLSNLVGNAVKFSDDGGEVHVRAREDADGVVIDVSDCCGGVAEDRLGGLFDAYEQAGRDRSGFGLGLAIVKQAVELHGGTIDVENRPGHGCTMVVRLPSAAEQPMLESQAQ